MDNNNDHYGVLGVLPDAEAVVITAAYRALAARYHPDRWQGSEQFAHERMAAINGAYEVLGNSEKRRNYDKQRQPHGTFDDASDETSHAFDDALKELEDRWAVAVSVLPALTGIRNRLAKTSHELAFAFVTLLLNTKQFGQAKQIADSMEQSFLERHFGTDPAILIFARELIALGLRDAIKALNKLVDVLGSNVDPTLLIIKVSREFDVIQKRKEAAEHAEEIHRRQVMNDKLYILKERLRSQPYIGLAQEAVELLGYSVVESGKSFFKDSTFTVSRNGNVVAAIISEAGFVRWVKQILAES